MLEETQNTPPKPSTPPKKTRTVGLDFGMARIGLSISDDNKIIAFPNATVTTEKKSEQTVDKVIATLQQLEKSYNCHIDEIIIGLPLRMNGKMSLLCDEVLHFVELFKTKCLTATIFTWDERLTTVQAERSLREGSLTRKRRSQIVDKVTAVIILQSYLDSKVRIER